MKMRILIFITQYENHIILVRLLHDLAFQNMSVGLTNLQMIITVTRGIYHSITILSSPSVTIHLPLNVLNRFLLITPTLFSYTFLPLLPPIYHSIFLTSSFSSHKFSFLPLLHTQFSSNSATDTLARWVNIRRTKDKRRSAQLKFVPPPRLLFFFFSSTNLCYTCRT